MRTHRLTPTTRLGFVSLGLLVALGAFATARCGDDDGDPCADACTVLGAKRCGGAVIQTCQASTDGCTGAWVDVQDCSQSGQICTDLGDGPACGTLCTDQCSSGASQCVGTVVQSCEANSDGCLRWVDATDCDDATLLCDLVSGDATCVAP